MAIKAYANNVLFYKSDNPSMRTILEPKLKLEINKAGSFSFSLYKNNPIYSQLQPLKTEIRVEDGDTLLFRGRVLEVKRDIFQQKKVTCEGDLTFLLDSQLAPVKVTETVRNFLIRVLNNHARQVDEQKWFYIGDTTISEANTSTEFDVTSYTSSSDVIDSQLLQVYGGILRTRYVNGTAFLDYIEDPSVNEAGFPVNDQGVRYGVNLIEFDEEYPVQDIFTVLLPIGKNKITIADVNNGSIFLEHQEAIAKFGRIVKVESWDDITNKNTLKSKAQAFLNNQAKVFPNDLTVKAVDLRCLDKTNTPIKLGDMVKVKIKPLDVDTTLFCLSIEYDFDNPENNSYKLGTFIPADKHKGSKKSSGGGGGRSRGGSGSSGKKLSSGLSDVTAEVADVKEQAKQDLELVYNNIDLKADNIMTLEGREIQLSAAIENHQSLITATGYALSLEVTNRQSGDNALASRISLAEDEIDLSVKKGSVINSINMSTESIVIQASKIELSGEVSAVSMQVDNLINGRMTATNIRAVSGDFQYLTVGTGGNSYKGASWHNVIRDGYVNSSHVNYLGDDDMNLTHYHSLTCSVNDTTGVVTFRLGVPQATAPTPSFNMADTTFFRDSVSAAKASMKIALDTTNHSISVSENGTLSGASVTSSTTLTYDSNTHKYTASGAAKISTTTMHTSSAESGTEAWNAVTLSNPTWNGSKSNNHSTYTVAAANGQYKSQAVYVAQDSGWSNGRKYIYLVPGSSNINDYVASATVNLPSDNSLTWSIRPAVATGTVYVTIGGRQYSHTFS